jgi:hypothetical protein
MIIRVKFEATVTEGEKKSVIEDSVDIHSPTDDLMWAKNLFNKWKANNSGIKGNSGVLHPLNGYGDIKIKSAEVLKEPKSKGGK